MKPTVRNLLPLFASLLLSVLTLFIFFGNGGRHFEHAFYTIPLANLAASVYSRSPGNWKELIFTPLLCMTVLPTLAFLLRGQLTPLAFLLLLLPLVLLNAVGLALGYCVTCLIAPPRRKPITSVLLLCCTAALLAFFVIPLTVHL